MARRLTRVGLAALGIAAIFICGRAGAQLDAAAPVQIPAPLPKDVSFARYIAQIRADLRTGDELVKQRNWSNAHAHFAFPREEIYGVIREELSSYQTPPFDAALVALARTVKARKIKQYPKALQRVEHALDRADANLRERQPNWPRFVTQVAVAVLHAAVDEYEDAAAQGRIVRPIGYQTARGFVLQADRMIESVAVPLSLAAPEPLADVRSGLSQLKQGLVNVSAPKQPLLQASDVTTIVSRIDTAAAKINLKQ